MIDKLKTLARLKGACEIRNEASDWEGLANLLFSPQGREFCIGNKFPDIATWSQINNIIDTTRFGVYIDQSTISLNNPKDVALIGHTDAKINFYGLDNSHKLILQHGSSAKVRVSEYAVVMIMKAPDCDIDIDNDGTGIILYE